VPGMIALHRSERIESLSRTAALLAAAWGGG
jgi:hypothetical protein